MENMMKYNLSITDSEERNMQPKTALQASLVQEFVGVAHGDLNRVQQMLAQEPGLINACWDWGGGDFESALGAAAHMGRKDIANFLLQKGARLDLFAAAMLGKLEIVKAALVAFPAALHTPGPHGIPLIAHAQAGGDEARDVLDYLETL
jgi:hypothetical protein